jgi:hypothetical protein
MPSTILVAADDERIQSALILLTSRCPAWTAVRLRNNCKSSARRFPGRPDCRRTRPAKAAQVAVVSWVSKPFR